MYDYAPTPRKIHMAVEEALSQALKSDKELIQPGRRELVQVQERTSLPKDEKQLHSLLMTEGDLAAGDLEIPVEWLEMLAQEGRAAYLEQGLWIAAEEAARYAVALGETEAEQNEDGGGREEQCRIVRRMLRYRGAADVCQTAGRYGWDVQTAGEILEELCRRGEAVKENDKYYHAELYRRAVIRTLKNQREEVQTCPAEAYAALLLSRMDTSAPAEESLRGLLKHYAGTTLPVSYWEGILFPRWVNNYRAAKLDAYLAEGELFWHMEDKGGLRFDYQEEVDWDAVFPERNLSEKEQLLYLTLQRRGASFMQSLNGLLGSESPYDTLMSLLEKGLVYADSFVPVRQWQDREKTRKASARQRVNMRVKALQAGRWDVVKPLREQSGEQSIKTRLERCFDRSLIVCRETAAACGISWQEALSVLRVQEYTGQVRRGYFVEGLSGAQFIRDKDYASVIRMLARPEKKVIWVNAADPVQCWGKILSHKEGRSFLNVPGSVAACYGGIPIVVMERQGHTLRVLDENLEGKKLLEECLAIFAENFRKAKLYPDSKRIVVKNYPDFTKDVLTSAGFFREMQDYVLYR